MSDSLKEVSTEELRRELRRREGERRCPTCGGKWSTYMGCSRSWQEEEHCFGCRKPVADCICSR